MDLKEIMKEFFNMLENCTLLSTTLLLCNMYHGLPRDLDLPECSGVDFF